ncbi:mercuric transport protein MerTP [Lewinella sp. JB7]|uniref:mercuric transport protein MerTP n=1 Tax=Lewinella sp. JB7 TaxID=2962887 RepID=UPI0020C975BC|nr:mercuric transport protein MerTP [Lewinella sp. JB7]MCP9236716.1 mercuric transport protein MerTP [Lewinella sp. JB7]
MDLIKRPGKAAFAGLLTAAAASICCITPVLAVLAGTSGMAATFAWMDPYRLYLIGITVVMLGVAWYQALRPRTEQEIACACDDDPQPGFFRSRSFLGITTAVVALMLSFPYYAKAFYPRPVREVVYVQQSNVAETEFTVEGMTCAGCEGHVESELNKLTGILTVKASYDRGNTVVTYDSTQVDAQQILEAINRTGYTATENHE